MSMKVALDLYFTEEFRTKLGKELGLPGMATRNDIRRWCKTILFIAAERVLGHEVPGAEEKPEASVEVSEPVNVVAPTIEEPTIFKTPEGSGS